MLSGTRGSTVRGRVTATGRSLSPTRTERGRRKERNVVEDPTVAVSVTDPDNPYRFLSVTGEVEEVTTEGAREHIDVLAERYMGEEEYPNRSRQSASSCASGPTRYTPAGSWPVDGAPAVAAALLSGISTRRRLCRPNTGRPVTI